MVDTVQEYVFFIIFLQNDLYFIYTEINVKKKMKSLYLMDITQLTK